MIDFIYIWSGVTFTLILLGFIMKEYFIGSVGAVCLMILGVHGMSSGFPDMSEWGNMVFSIFAILIGLYVLIKGTLEQFYN